MVESLPSEYRGWEGGSQRRGESGEYSQCRFKGRNDRQKHGKTERQVQADRPTQIID